MVEINVGEVSDLLCKAVSHYSMKNLLSNGEYSRLNVRGKNRSRDRDGKLKLEYYLPEGTNDIIYKNINIQIISKIKGQPFEINCSSHQHMEIVLKANPIIENDTDSQPRRNKDNPNNQENTNSEPLKEMTNKDVFNQLNDFIEEAKDYYIDNVLDREKDNEKVNVYIYDDYWELLNKHPKRKIDTICLEKDKQNEILENMKEFYKSETEEKYRRLGLCYKKNYLFYGFPGTGKSSLIYALASELDMNLGFLNFDSSVNDNVLMKAITRIPENSIIVLEDIDSLFQERKKNDEHKNAVTLVGLLNTLDGIVHQDKQIIILTTNYKGHLDKALIRKGRIDCMLEFGYAKKGQIRKMFLNFFPQEEQNFESFYKTIKNVKLTTAVLQPYLFKYMDSNIRDVINNTKELIDDAVECNYEENKNMYM